MEPVNLNVKILQEIRDGQSRVEERLIVNQEQTNQRFEMMVVAQQRLGLAPPSHESLVEQRLRFGGGHRSQRRPVTAERGVGIESTLKNVAAQMAMFARGRFESSAPH